jgi:uncharacterized protein
MLLLDVNILVYAHREEMLQHGPIRQWLTELVHGPTSFGVPELAGSGFVRIVTNPKAFKSPTPTNVALDFCAALFQSPHCLIVRPAPTQWSTFDRLCRHANARGKLVPDAYFAAMAIDHHCEWITTDRDYRRFPGLTWRHPLDAHARTNPR